MKLKDIVFIILICFTTSSVVAQSIEYTKDSVQISKIYAESLENGEAYSHLKDLCKNIGNRLSGSLGAVMAIKWGKHVLSGYPFDTVYLQPVMVPHWERGTKEQCYVEKVNGNINQLTTLALGGSVGTNGIISGELVMFKSLKALENAKRKEVEGKIVFVAEKMTQQFPNAFRAYSHSYPIRGHSAVLAAQKGAKAVIIRSLSLSENDFPNTGTMRYNDSIKRIPAAAVSTQDATKLEKYMDTTSKAPTLYLQMGCKWYPDVQSYNVIAAIKGATHPNQYITVGGHIDSWDVGEGAHDDGAGITQSLEALRILQAINYQPKYTLRVVFFINEENGNKGGITYARLAKENKEKHLYAIESDEGGFTPRGFSIDGHIDAFKLTQKFIPLFEPYFIHHFVRGYSGVDITPLKHQFDSIGLFELTPDSQRYFTIHHNNNDVFENINKRELQMGAATLSALIYLLDKYGS